MSYSDPYGLCPKELTGEDCETPVDAQDENGIVTLRKTRANEYMGLFGMTRNGGTRAHQGVDILAPVGTNVRAAGSGTVTVASDNGGGHGLRVQIAHKDAAGNVVSHTSYSHLSSLAAGIKPGATVSAGDVIGAVGRSGNASGAGIPPHLHFEIRTSATPGRGLADRINPAHVGIPMKF